VPFLGFKEPFFAIISFNVKTFLPETGILGFFLTSLFSDLVGLGFME